MAPVARHPLHGLQRGLDAHQGCGLPDPSQIMGRDRRQKIQADVGGRGTGGNGGPGNFLKIVRRQEVFFCRHESFKIPPCAARDQPQLLRLRNR